VLGASGMIAYCLKLDGEAVTKLPLRQIVPVVIVTGIYMAIHTLPW
jgi:hypothetical protein